MQHTIIPPREPQKQEPVRPPMIYIEKRLKWEYKQIVRNLKKEGILSDAELNALGEEGWEMSGVAQQSPMTYFYFKRQVEK
jgi:hypothetical protein